MKCLTDAITFFKICLDKDPYNESNKSDNDIKLDILNKLNENANSNRYKYDEHFMNEAFKISKFSSSNKMKVGCIIVKNNQILSTGYNRCIINYESADKSPNENTIDNSNEEPCEDLNGKTKWHIIHAEVDCIMNFILSNNYNNINDCRIFCTLSPCRDCAKFILRSGIKEIIYKDEYKRIDGIEFLINNGVNVYKLK